MIDWIERRRARAVAVRLGIAWGLVLAAQAASAQQPDTARRQPTDSGRRAQPIPSVHVEARPNPKPVSESEERVRFGGHLYTQADFERVGARGWTDMARMTPGVTLATGPIGKNAAQRHDVTMFFRRLQMIGTGGHCTPTVWLDGVRTVVTEYDWDEFIPIEHVDRMEVYSAANVPQRFRALNGECGSIVIWTRPETPRP